MHSFLREQVHVAFLYGAQNSFEKEGQFICISDHNIESEIISWAWKTFLVALAFLKMVMHYLVSLSCTNKQHLTSSKNKILSFSDAQEVVR